MPEISERVQIIQAMFAGLKDILLVVASVATIWIQSGNSAKLDVAAAKTEQVKETLEASGQIRDQKLDAAVKGVEELRSEVKASMPPTN